MLTFASIGGFSQTGCLPRLLCLSNMKKNEKGIVAFYSVYGYGTNGKGSIPKYAPISFEIELVPKPEE